MASLTEEQLREVQSLRESLIEARAKLERLHIADSLASVVWDRLSNAHAALGRLLENERAQDRTRGKGAGV